MRKYLYKVERRQERVYNALTGRLSRGHVVVYDNPLATGGPIRQLLPGTWTKTAAEHIASTMNTANKKS